LRVVVLALLAAAAFESSTWVGGVMFALAAPLMGVALLWHAEPDARLRLLARFAFAALLTIGLAAPFLLDQVGLAAAHEAGAPIALAPHEVLGDALSDRLRRLLDLPAYWLVLLPVELPAIYLTGVVAAAALRRTTSDPAIRRDALALALLAFAGLMVSWLLASTLGDNNDLGWRAALPPVAVLTVFAAAGLAHWVAARAAVAVAAALVAIALGLPRAYEILRDNAAGHMQPDAAVFAQAPAMWAAVRRHSLPDERVGNNPLALRAATPWPVNIGWALLANRRSCYAGREFALVFTGLPAARRAEIDAQFVRRRGLARRPARSRDALRLPRDRAHRGRRRLDERSVRGEPVLSRGRKRARPVEGLPRARARGRRLPVIAHDPEKWTPVFGKDHAQT
jgi:hypothetical protein